MSQNSRVWLRDRRLALRLRQTDVYYRTQLLGAPIREQLLGQLENGRLGLLDISAAQTVALRRVLDITDAEWEALMVAV